MASDSNGSFWVESIKETSRQIVESVKLTLRVSGRLVDVKVRSGRLTQEHRMLGR